MAIECYSLKVEQICFGSVMQNVLHYIVDNNDDATPIQISKELVGLFGNTPVTKMRDCCSERWAVRWIEAKRILPGGGNSAWLEFPLGTKDGTNVANVASLSTSVIVKLYSALASGLQGRIYMPPPYEGAMEDNVLDTAYHNDIMEFVAAAYTLTDDHTFNLAIYSKKTNTAGAVQTYQISPIIGNIGRRRTPG